MKKFFKSKSLAIGLALFSMFFGAGNIIFPLALGQYAQDKNIYAILGLILTAVLMPVLGVIAMILYEGDCKKFFGRVGRIPGFLLAFLTIALLGPLGSTPRCIALSYGALKESLAGCSIVVFSAIFCGIVFLCTVRKQWILTLLGWVLTPVLLLTLTALIIIGFIAPHDLSVLTESSFSVFLHGLKEGYNTMDLLAAFFFSSTILGLLRANSSAQESRRTLFKASLIGVFLLSMIYIGFSYLAAFHANALGITDKGDLLTAIVFKIAGPYGKLLVAVTVTFACLTTAIALISAFTEFMHKQVLLKKISYKMTLIGSLFVTFVISTFEFTGISYFLGPILEICYPVLIGLTFFNIIAVMFKKREFAQI